eukprot:4534-Heterococcus_DN1.PRE.2
MADRALKLATRLGLGVAGVAALLKGVKEESAGEGTHFLVPGLQSSSHPSAIISVLLPCFAAQHCMTQ